MTAKTAEAVRKTVAEARNEDPSFPLRLGFRLVQPTGVTGCKLCGCPTHPQTACGPQGQYCEGCAKSLQLGLRQVASPRRTVKGPGNTRLAFYAHAQTPEVAEAARKAAEE